MDVCHEWGVVPLLAQYPLDLFERLHLAESLGGEADHLGTCIPHRIALGYSRFYVICVTIAHGLNHYRKTPSDLKTRYICYDIFHNKSFSQN